MFRPELAEQVMRVQKTCTRRACSDNPRSPWWREQCGVKVGQVVAIQPGRGKPRIGTATVASVARELFDPASISEDEARAEGFASAEAFRGTWVALHGALEPVEVWRIGLADPVRVDTEEAER